MEKYLAVSKHGFWKPQEQVILLWLIYKVGIKMPGKVPLNITQVNSSQLHQDAPLCYQLCILFQCCWISEISEIYGVTSKWPWTLSSQRYLAYSKYLPLRPKFWSISLYGEPFSIYQVVKIVNAPNDLILECCFTPLDLPPGSIAKYYKLSVFT